MQVTEIKNDLVQVRYDVNEQALVLGDFLLVSDNNSDILAQIIVMESDDNGAFCIAKFILNVNKDNSVSQYSGYMPSFDATVYPVSKREIIDFITPLSDGLKLGKLINSNYDVVLSNFILEAPLYIQSDYSPSCAKLLQFVYLQNQIENNTVFFDCDGTFSQFDANVAVLGENVKLPLNEFFIDFIYNNDLEELTIAQKALVQDILLEIKDYIKTTEKDFLEFETLINVVDGQYQDQPDDALILFRNKLIEYRQLGYFANSNDEVQTIYNAINGNMTLFSCERLAKNWQKALMNFVSENISQKTHFVVQLTNDNIDELTINTILNSKSINPIFISNYSFEYRNVLRSKISNMIFFQAIDNLNDFPLYVNYLNILFDDSFVVWGDITSHLSIIATLNESENDVDITAQFDTQVSVDNLSDTDYENQKYDEDVVDASVVNVVENNLPQDDIYEEHVENDNADISEEIANEQPDMSVDIAEELEVSDEFGEDNNLIEDNIEDEIVTQETSIQDNNQSFEQEHVEIIEEESEYVSDEEADEFISEDIDESDLDNLDGLSSENIEEIQDEDALGTQQNEIIENVDEQVLTDEIEPELLDNETIVEGRLENESQNILGNDINATDDLDEISSENDDYQNDVVSTEYAENATNFEDNDQEVEQSQEEQIVEQIEEPKFQMPVYDSDTVEQPQNDVGVGFVEGNLVFHEKYGKGIIEKVISYGAKTLCSIQFDNVGRRLLDPNLADLKHV